MRHPRHGSGVLSDTFQEDWAQRWIDFTCCVCQRVESDLDQHRPWREMDLYWFGVGLLSQMGGLVVLHTLICVPQRSLPGKRPRIRSLHVHLSRKNWLDHVSNGIRDVSK